MYILHTNYRNRNNMTVLYITIHGSLKLMYNVDYIVYGLLRWDSDCHFTGHRLEEYTVSGRESGSRKTT